MAKKSKKTSKGMSGGKMAAVGAGVAAIGAGLGAGAYYLMGPKGRAHQKKAVALISKIKKDVSVQMKKAKAMSGPMYQEAVDVISKKYAKEYKAHEKEINDIAMHLKKEWANVKKDKNVKKSVKLVKKLKAKIGKNHK